MRQRTKRLHPVMVLAVCVTGAAAAVGQFPQAPSDGVRLCSGAIVDRDRAQIYMMRPGGGIDAIRLSGEIAWATDEASKPLQLAGGVLLAQQESLTADGDLGLQRLDANAGTRLGQPASVGLPAGVWAFIDDGPGKSLATDASLSPGGIVVTWQAIARPLGALLTPPSTVSGAAMVNPSTGDVSVVDQITELPPAVPVDVPEGQGIAGVPGTQYFSADGGHVLVSERVTDESVWEKFQWSIYSLETGERLADVFHHLPRAAFIVVGSTFVYESRPFGRRLGEDWLEAPLELRAIDLTSGAELWKRPLRDTTYRGLLPP